LKGWAIFSRSLRDEEKNDAKHILAVGQYGFVIEFGFAPTPYWWSPQLKRLVVFWIFVLAFPAADALGQALPRLFDFTVQLPPELAQAQAVDLRLRVFDAKSAHPLYEEVLPDLKPEGRRTIELEVGRHREQPLPHTLLSGRLVRYEIAARPAGQGAFVPVYSSPDVQMVFEHSMSVWEKIRLDRWVVLGFIGQIVFMLRFLIQWIASERRRESVVPVAFWYCSLLGGAIVLLYGIVESEPIIILGQGLGFIVYGRNLYLIYRKRAEGARADLDPDGTASGK
jgi:lipid-A-disaccharide synthase-like uncharacterized protein